MLMVGNNFWLDKNAVNIDCSPRLFLFKKSVQPFYLHSMDFYKLSDFQLYSIINSRHLDKENKAKAERELERRQLSEEEVQKLKNELTEKTKTTSSFLNLSPNVWLLIGAIVLLFLMRQCNISH